MTCPQDTYKDTFKLGIVSYIFSDFPSPAPRKPWEVLFKLQPNQRSLVSYIDGGLLSFNTEQCSESAAAWEQELGVQFEEDFWESAITGIRNSSSSVLSVEAHPATCVMFASCPKLEHY